MVPTDDGARFPGGAKPVTGKRKEDVTDLALLRVSRPKEIKVDAAASRGQGVGNPRERMS